MPKSTKAFLLFPLNGWNKKNIFYIEKKIELKKFLAKSTIIVSNQMNQTSEFFVGKNQGNFRKKIQGVNFKRTLFANNLQTASSLYSRTVNFTSSEFR